jgi:hypothetical protein
MATLKQPLYGLMAEFETPEQVLQAALRTRAAGYRRLDAYSPMPVEGLAEAIGFEWTSLPMVVFTGGFLGGCTGFFMCWYANVISFPLNIGGKPLNSWPAWIPITYELTILGAALAAVFGMIIMNGLPQPYHPVFNVSRFASASADRFFLVIEAHDGKFDLAQTKAFLQEMNPQGVFEVES